MVNATLFGTDLQEDLVIYVHNSINTKYKIQYKGWNLWENSPNLDSISIWYAVMDINLIQFLLK